MKKSNILFGLVLFFFNFQTQAAELALFPVYSCHGGYGLINANGEMIVKPQYQWINDFHEGLAAIETANSWGFIDVTGRVTIKPQFAHAGDFSEGLAMVANSIRGDDPKRRVGFIDTTGKLVIPMQFTDAKDFSDGLAAVKQNGQWKYIDKTGNVVFQFNTIYNAPLKRLSPEVIHALNKFPNVRHYKNANGETYIKLQCWPQSFKNGLAPVTCMAGGVQFNGYINKAGKFAWDPLNSCYNQPTGM
jgi:hypothetical protein